MADGVVLPEGRGLASQRPALQHAQQENSRIVPSSTHSTLSGLIEWAVGETSADRLLFGADTPLYWTICQKARIESAEINREAKEAILMTNADRLLHVEVA